MYKLKLTKLQKDVFKAAFKSYFDLRKNKWGQFVKDMKMEKSAVKEFKKIFKEMCPNGIVLDTEKVINVSELVIYDKEELRTVIDVIEEYIRVRMGQFWDFTDDLARDGYIYDNNNPDNDRLFHKYIDRRNKAKDDFEVLFLKARDYNRYKIDQVLIAEDIWDVLKKQYWDDTPETHNTWSTWSHNPLHWYKQEPLPEIEVIGAEYVR